MVRVISEKLFSPPRSRHSSGETVDKELAARAVVALSSLNSATATNSTTTTSRRGVSELSSDYESSSDSHWDSEVDGAEDRGDHGEDCSGGAGVVQKRKERRRERNKLSAQAYRIRRREQCVKQQTVLEELQEKNSLLKDEVLSLEEQIGQLRRSASTTATLPRPPPPPPPHPHSPTPTSTSTSRATTPTPATPTTIPPLPPPLPPPPALDNPHQSLHLQPPPGMMRICRSREGIRSPPHGFVATDNDLTTPRSRQQLLSPPPPPVVDNFSFSHQPSPPSPSPTAAASPSAASSSSSSFPGFSFPVPSSSPAVCSRGRLTPGVFLQPPFVPPANVMGEGVPQGPAYHHPHSHPHQLFHIPPPPPLPLLPPPVHPPQLIDFNANAEEGPRSSNLNNNNNNARTATVAATTTATASFWGSFQKSDNVNNNTDSVVSATSSFGGARPKTTNAVGALNLVMRSSEVFK